MHKAFENIKPPQMANPKPKQLHSTTLVRPTTTTKIVQLAPERKITVNK